ncbi:MAG: phosphocholine cytidylyltransferase family protein [Halobacteriovoraceae bacterium]|nr:phosphocholine cytidylyltransferase family protein [Halobacteriovoraceae bacterium]
MDTNQLNQDYTAIVLAAGYGSRIKEMVDIPKCLIELNGKTLLERNFEIWKNLNIKKVTLVLGHKKEMIEDLVEKYTEHFEFNLCVNEDYYNKGNTYSLMLGLKDVTGPSLIFDADLVYDQNILEEFISDDHNDQILVGPSDLSDIECAKTLTDEKGYVRKTVDKRAVSQEELEKFSFVGEAIGILKFSTDQTLKLYQEAKNFLSIDKNLILNWEHLLNDYLTHNLVGYHMLKSGRWIEIDTPEDYENAKRIFQ